MRQIDIAKAANTTQPAISNILTGKRRPSWDLAKRLAEATNTDPVLWMDATPEEIRAALKTKTDRNAAVNEYSDSEPEAMN